MYFEHSAYLSAYSVRAHMIQSHNLPSFRSVSKKMRPTFYGKPLMPSWSPSLLKWRKIIPLSESGIGKMEHDNTKEFPKVLQNRCWNTKKESTPRSCFRDSGLALRTKSMSVCELHQQYILCQTTASFLIFYTCNTEDTKYWGRSIPLW